MQINEAKEMARELIESSRVVMVGTNGDEGHPNIKAMFNVEHEGLDRVWLSTNTSSHRVSQLRHDPRACLYFFSAEKAIGLMLVGEMEILQDRASRERLWSPGCEVYYPLGVNDPDYSVLRFTAHTGNIYHGLQNLSFEL